MPLDQCEKEIFIRILFLEANSHKRPVFVPGIVFVLLCSLVSSPGLCSCLCTPGSQTFVSGHQFWNVSLRVAVKQNVMNSSDERIAVADWEGGNNGAGS